jgi:putative addiction module component (TIGR02574 family)
MSLEELHAESRRLPREQAAALIDLLLVDVFNQPDPSVDEAWGREIDRRLAELENGTVKGIPAEEVMAKARKLVGL